MNRIQITISIIITLLIGGFLGYYFTNSHYLSKEASEADSAERIICTLELREGSIGEVKSKYTAIMEGRDKVIVTNTSLLAAFLMIRSYSG